MSDMKHGKKRAKTFFFYGELTCEERMYGIIIE